jgi:hypothetical protein
MGARALEPSHVVLGTGDTEVVAALGTDETRQITLVIGNTASAEVTFRLHVYDDDAAETAEQANAIAGYFDRHIGPNGEESIVLAMHLVFGWKISGQCSVDSALTIHIFPTEL